ncbi:hypothetical protein VNO78_29169 [Psophocarpus tetragonolobus]|uniref:CTLH domain-containing protein n=1 Tax=Psophocarpus tetragonolobus TaxID=3891 RepID=A0AAN9X0T3_PSOTE
MSHHNKDLFFIEQRTFGRESGLPFYLHHFEEMVLQGKWDEAENYLSGFTKINDNNYSIKIYFEMRKQKYFEALECNNRHKALDILLKDLNLRVFTLGNEALFKDLSYLLILNNIRELKPTYQDENSARKNLLAEIKELMYEHPLLGGLLKFSDTESQRLKGQKFENVDKKPNLLMKHGNSEASTSSPSNSGTVMAWKLPSTNGRPSMESDKLSLSGNRNLDLNISIEESRNKSKNLFDICAPSQCRFLKLPMCSEVKKIVRLAYNNAGNAIIALASNGIHLVWAWLRTDLNLDNKASTQFGPKLWHPKDGPQYMINDLSNVKLGNNVSCLALSKVDGYIISTSGGMVSLFNIMTFKTLATIMSPPPMVTCFAFYPKDNNIFGIGFDDSTILIYHVRRQEVLYKLEGHSKRVTAVAFSNTSNTLISCDASAQIILWNTEGWEKVKDRHLQIQGNCQVPESETQIQFHPDQIKFLVVNTTHAHLAIYEANELRCVNQWIPEVPELIYQATFSSDGHTVYSIFVSGTVAMFDASNFEIRRRIHPSSYLSPTSSSSMSKIYPVSIAAHPQKPTQIAVGLSDGSTYVLEPQDPADNW